MRYKPSVNIFIFTILLFSSSCEKEITIETPDMQDKLVVHSTFRPFTTPYVKDFQVQLTDSRSILDNRKFDTIAGAEICLFEDNKILDTLNYIDSLGIYQCDEFPESGKEYRIQAKKKGYPEIIASDRVPSKIIVNSIEVDTVAFRDDMGSYYSRITISLRDPGNNKNYYEIRVKSAGGDRFWDISTNDISIVNERYYPSQLDPGFEYPSRLLFTDNRFDGERKQVSFFFSPAQYIEFENNNKVRYYYDQIIQIYFRSVSKKYYLYYTSLLEKLDNQEGDILYGMAEPLEVPSNIRGGYGIFAGYQVDIKQFRIREQRVN